MPRRNIIENRVKSVLHSDEESRNDDIRLTQVYWWNFHRDNVKTFEGKPYIALQDLHKLPTQDSIKRVRAKIQNEQHLYLPTRKDVAIKRLGSEDEWRKYLGYPTDNTL